MADAAFLKAQYAKGQGQRVEYLSTAAGWHAMALEMEADFRRLAQFEASQNWLGAAARKERDQPPLNPMSARTAIIFPRQA
jgi:hypothetical protein